MALQAPQAEVQRVHRSQRPRPASAWARKPSQKTSFDECTANQSLATRYDRNLEARRWCIQLYGTDCHAYGFSFRRRRGDLDLIGRPLLGHVIAERAGHAMHTALVAKIMSNPSLYEIVTFDDLAARVAESLVLA